MEWGYVIVAGNPPAPAAPGSFGRSADAMAECRRLTRARVAEVGADAADAEDWHVVAVRYADSAPDYGNARRVY